MIATTPAEHEAHEFEKQLSIACLAALSGIVQTQPALADQPQRPNVLWIYLEDVSGWFGCYGEH
ncbi:MAG: hypothetical protein R3C05_04885 [Pirellulaceae bacterium]